MKRHGGLWESLLGWDNLLLAARKAQRGKRSRHAVQSFNFGQESQLLRLKDELESGAYVPGPFHTHRITRPKSRLISAAPYRDRVVHHAIMNVLEPILDRRFHPHSYACRKGKGTHAASDRLRDLMRRRKFALQCDVRKFFPSIDHEILKSTFRRVVKDIRLLALMDRVVDASNAQDAVLDWFPGDTLFSPLERRRGLPIGNLTSQWFANWALDGLDHFVTSRLGIGAYVRYCDDFVLLHDDRAVLAEAARQAREFLAARRLTLHEEKLSLRPVTAGLKFVGYRHWPTHRLLPKGNVRAFRRRVAWMRRAYAARRIDASEVRPRIVSWMAHAGHADSKRLIRRIGQEWTFRRRPAAARSGRDR